MSKAVLFDLDGTLLDSEPDFSFILNEMLREQRRTVSSKLMRQTVSDGARAMIRLAYEIDETDTAFDSRLAEFLDRYETLIPETRSGLFEGIDTLIRDLEKAGFTWGIVTNKTSRFALPLVAGFEQFASASTLVCADQVAAGKPDPEGLIKACNECGCSIEQALYVGDHPRDIEAASNAGMPGIAVTWGYLPASPPVSEWQASAIIHTPGELMQYLENIY